MWAVVGNPESDEGRFQIVRRLIGDGSFVRLFVRWFVRCSLSLPSSFVRRSFVRRSSVVLLSPFVRSSLSFAVVHWLFVKLNFVGQEVRHIRWWHALCWLTRFGVCLKNAFARRLLTEEEVPRARPTFVVEEHSAVCVLVRFSVLLLFSVRGFLARCFCCCFRPLFVHFLVSGVFVPLGGGEVQLRLWQETRPFCCCRSQHTCFELKQPQ